MSKSHGIAPPVSVRTRIFHLSSPTTTNWLVGIGQLSVQTCDLRVRLSVLPLVSDSWQSFLDAPVPFLAGVPRGHPITRRLSTSAAGADGAESDLGPHDHLFVVDLNDNTVRIGDGGEPQLPGIDGLAGALQPIIDRLRGVDIAPTRLGTAGFRSRCNGARRG